MRTVYLSCFSTARDDPNQWRLYGDSGKGVCLGIRALQEPYHPKPGLVSATLDVNYSESSLRDWLTQTFSSTCAVLGPAARSQRNREEGLFWFYYLAAIASVTAKRAKFAIEQEVRHVTFPIDEKAIGECMSETGRRYLPISLRDPGKLIAFDEIIIGQNCEFAEARARIENALKEEGYTVGSIEYPRITTSEVSIDRNS